VRGLCMYGVTNCCQMLAQLNFDNMSWYIMEAHFDSRDVTQIKEEADETPNDGVAPCEMFVIQLNLSSFT